MKLIHISSCLFLLFSAAEAKAESKSNDQDRVALWSVSYLHNILFAQELPAYIKANQLKAKARDDFFKTELGKQLWARSALGISKAKQSKQPLLLSKQDLTLIEAAAKINKAGTDQKSLNALVMQSFPDDASKARWQAINHSPQPLACTAQKKQLAAIHNSDAARDPFAQPDKFLTAAATIKAEEMPCLLQSAAQDPKINSLSFLHALVHFHKGYEGNLMVQNLYSAELVRHQLYPEALRQLFDLQKLDENNRLIYDIVQKQFNYHQRGRGEVVIKTP